MLILQFTQNEKLTGIQTLNCIYKDDNTAVHTKREPDRNPDVKLYLQRRYIVGAKMLILQFTQNEKLTGIQTLNCIYKDDNTAVHTKRKPDRNPDVKLYLQR